MVILYFLAGVVGLLISYFIAWGLYMHARRKLYELALLDHDLALKALNLAQLRTHLTTIFPDAQGNFPLLSDGLSILDPNRGASFTLKGLSRVAPELARPEQMARLLRAAGGWPERGDSLLPPAPGVNWPDRVPLSSILDEPGVHNLVLGVTVREDGQTEVVKADMARMVHVAVGGSSGWGKSVFLRAIAYQLAKSVQPVALAMVDLEGSTLSPFARCERLMYPIADTERAALAVFQELLEEMDRRRELYNRCPGVDSLAAYNAQAGESLAPVVCIVDEATALLGDRSVESALRTLALRARKYGLWLLLAGQDWKASSLDTAIRNQLSSRIQFKAMSASQSRVLLERSGAEALDVVGRALCILPGRGMIMVQTPYISSRDIIADLGNGGPQNELPGSSGIDDPVAQRIREMWAEGEGLGRIAETIYGYRNARATARIKEILGLRTV